MCFEEDLENCYGEKIFVMRGTYPSLIASAIQERLKKENIKVGVTKIKNLKPT